jgi:hypothetical protein
MDILKWTLNYCIQKKILSIIFNSMSTYQSSSSYRVTSSSQSSSNQRNLEGEIYDLVGESQALLRWSEVEGG